MTHVKIRAATVAARARGLLRGSRAGGALLLGTRLLGMPLSMVTTIILTRWLSTAQFGYFATALALATASNSLNLAGFDQLYLQRRLTEPQLRRALLLWTCLFLTVSCIAALTYPGLPGEARLCVILIAAGFAFTILAAPALLRPQRALDFARRGRLELGQKGVVVIAVAVVSLTSPSLTAAGAAMLLGSALFFLASRFKRQPESSSSAIRFRREIREAAPYSAGSALFALTRQMPVLALGALAAVEDVAHFRAAFAVYLAMQLLPTAMNNEVLRPRLYVRSGNLSSLLRESLIINLACGVLITVVTIIAAELLTVFTFGEAYRPAASYLRVLAIAFPFFCLANWLDSVLIAAGHERTMVARLVLGLVATSALAWTFGTAGPEVVSYVVLVSEVVSLVFAGAPLLWNREVRSSLVRPTHGAVRAAPVDP